MSVSMWGFTNDRIQLIEEEKELQKLKEEMNAGPA